MPSKNARLRRRKENRKRRDNAKRREELKQADRSRREALAEDHKIIQSVDDDTNKSTLMESMSRILRPSNASRSKTDLDDVHKAAVKARSMKTDPVEDSKNGGPGRGVKAAMVIAVLAMMALLVIPNFL